MLKVCLVATVMAVGLVSFSSDALASSTSIKSFCSETNVQQKLKNSSNRMAFTNRGGLLNGGVCWWHSRFLRNAAYLTYFSPDKAKPHHETKVQLLRIPNFRARQRIRVPAPGSVEYIIEKIKVGKEVVEIPGFSDFNSFSSYYANEIQDVLDAWQMEDGVIDQSWIIGLNGSSEVEPDEMKAGMDSLYERISAGEAVYQKLQIRGITAHAWLVVGMSQTRDGYSLEVIDSNYKTIQSYNYRVGDTSLYHRYYGNFVPYSGKFKEESRLKRVKSKFCK